MLKIDDWMVAWTPHTNRIEVGPWPDETGWSDAPRYAFTSGCCYVERHRMTTAMKVAMMFIDFHTIVVRDGIDPQLAHRAFLNIREYRLRISPDINGAINENEAPPIGDIVAGWLGR